MQKLKKIRIIQLNNQRANLKDTKELEIMRERKLTVSEGGKERKEQGQRAERKPQIIKSSDKNRNFNFQLGKNRTVRHEER